MVCFGQKGKITTTTKQNIKHKNPCRSWEFNPGPLAPKADLLPLHHRVNVSNDKTRYLTDSTQYFETKINKAEFTGHPFSTHSFFL